MKVEIRLDGYLKKDGSLEWPEGRDIRMKLYETEQDGLKITYHRDKGKVRREIYDGNETNVVEVEAPTLKHYLGLVGVITAELGVASLGICYLCTGDPPFNQSEMPLRILALGSAIFFLGPGPGLTRVTFDKTFEDYMKILKEMDKLRDTVQELEKSKSTQDYSTRTLEGMLGNFREKIAT